MASCVATGTPFFDIPTNKGNIVYIAAEGQFGMRKRISAWEVEQGIPIALEPFNFCQIDKAVDHFFTHKIANMSFVYIVHDRSSTNITNTSSTKQR